MEHCKEHDIPFDEMGYCALGCSGWELMEERISELEQENARLRGALGKMSWIRSVDEAKEIAQQALEETK